MNGADIMVIVWLMGLTVAQVISAAAMMATKRQTAIIEQRASELDTAERMQRIIDMIGKNKSAIDQDIRRNAEILIGSLEADPLAKEKHWMAMQQLRSKLAHL